MCSLAFLKICLNFLCLSDWWQTHLDAWFILGLTHFFLPTLFFILIGSVCAILPFIIWHSVSSKCLEHGRRNSSLSVEDRIFLLRVTYLFRNVISILLDKLWKKGPLYSPECPQRTGPMSIMREVNCGVLRQGGRGELDT